MQSVPLLSSSASFVGTVESDNPSPERSESRAPAVTVTRIDGTKLQGTWAGCPDGKTLQIQTETGLQELALHGLERVTNPATPSAPDQSRNAMAGAAVFYPSDAGLLYGRLDSAPRASSDAVEQAAVQDVIYATTALGTHLAFPFDRLAAVRLGNPKEQPDSHTLFDEARSNQLAAKDVLITKRTEDLSPTAIRGLLASLNALDGAFSFGGRLRSFQTDRVYGVVFAAGAPAGGEPPDGGVRVSIRDGSQFQGRLQPLKACGLGEGRTGSEESICVRTSLGPTVALSWADVLDLRIHSKRVVYVSSLAPEKEEVQGIVHRTVSGLSPWPVGRDRSTTGGPLSLGGHYFERGLGVHSASELVYELDGVYDAFVASIGIDDAVRPRGSVVFRVAGDDRVLFDSGELTGRNEPQDIIVDIGGIEILTLEVDYGQDLDIADAAIWGGARLLRPAH